MTDSFWDRVAMRVRPTDTLKTIESPRVIAVAFTAAMWASAAWVLAAAGLWAFFDEPDVAWVAVALAGVFVAAWIVFAATGSVFVASFTVFVAGTVANVYAHVALGGYAYSGAVMLFGIAYVVIEALILGRRMAIFGVVTYAALAVVLGFMEASLQASREAPDPALSTTFFVFVLIGSITVLAPMIVYFLARLRYERERAEGLLLNVLPAEIATELKQHGTTAARHYDDISVLFADIVGFTPLSAEMDPDEMVGLLNDVFTHFDTLADRYGAEKIRTIGDNYMVAAGVPTPTADHARVLCAMAIDMITYAAAGPLSFRIGINTGPAVAGVIGTRKFQYDLWGDTVNTASRMESHGQPGRIQITEATYHLINDIYPTTRRGPIDIKGKGTLTTYWLDTPATQTVGPEHD